nr:PREDICTED: ankyrin-1-like [Latimeria chalumnae]|eukprot:XP_014353437.1 PREDICTED: ankyrin-1-like [Latimeria chalumnae]
MLVCIFLQDNRTVLHVAAAHSKDEIVRNLLSRRADPNLPGGPKHQTPLHYAAARPNGALGVIQTLLKASHKDARLAQDKSGAVCLHAAAKRGHAAVVKALLLKGAHVDAKTKDSYTALHIAVQYCKPLVVQTLLGFGAQVQLKGGKAQETPLHIAARVKEGEKVAEMLLKSGVDVNAEQENGETAMHMAARHGSLKMMQALIEEGGDLMWQSKAEENPLHIAVRHCHLHVVEDVLCYLDTEKSHTEAVMCVNQENVEGETPLHLAAEIRKDMVHFEGEETRIIKLLMEFEADTTAVTKLTTETPLHYCARVGNISVLLEILKHISSNRMQQAINKQAKNGWSPLLVSAERGHTEIVKTLLQNHARVDVFDEHGKAALHLAAENGYDQIADILLWHKAFVNAKTKLGLTPLHLGAQNGFNRLVKLLVETHLASIDALSLTKRTPLHLAALNGQLDVCNSLLKMKADVNATDITNDSSPLHLAAAGGYAEVVKVLLEAGASASDENAEGMTPIHLAAKNGHINVLEALKGSVSFKLTSTRTGFSALHVAAQFGQLDFAREILTKVSATVCSEAPKSTVEGQQLKEQTSESGYTPLHLSAQYGHESLVRLLLNHAGVQADTQTSLQGSSPLHLAAQNGHTAVVGLLLSKSTSQLHLKNKRGRTCLHLAAANGHIEMVRVLLGQGAEINVTDKNGWTPLHFAAKSGYLETVRFLMESGASPKLECKEGKMAIQYTAAENHQEVVSFLLKKNNTTLKLTEDRRFIFDLMVCGKQNSNRIIEEFVLHSPAPLDTAVKLSRAFSLTALKEKERSMDLVNAARYCESMANELLTVASGSKSAGYLLRAMDHRGTTMLDSLIECEQKNVVAHPAVQKYLTEVWYGNLKWAPWKIALLFFSFLVCPPVWLVFSLPLKHRFNKIPIMKFMSYLVSHIFLLVLFIITIVYPPLSPIYKGRMIPYWNEWLLLVWLSGMLVSELTHPGERAGLAWIRVFVLGFSAVAFFCHLLAFAFDDTDRLHCLFARNIFLSVAMTLCFVQFLEFLTFHHLFGPWAIIIRDLMKDLTRFTVILVLFHLAFTMHLSAVYQPVYPEPVIDPSLGNGTGNAGMSSAIQDPVDVTVILFFSLFGLVDPDSLPPLSRTPQFTFVIIRFVFGVYLVVTLIVLINLLIAMMSDTYQRIQAHSDTEWKFGRATLIRDMTRKSGTPSPFNLFTNLFYYIKMLCRHGGKLCSTNGRGLMHEEEDLDRISDTRSIDLLAHTSVGWIQTSAKRSTKVSPEGNITGGFCRGSRSSGPAHIDKVIDWHRVALRYLALKGQVDVALFEKDSAQHEDNSTGSERFSIPVNTKFLNGVS